MTINNTYNDDNASDDNSSAANVPADDTSQEVQPSDESIAGQDSDTVDNYSSADDSTFGQTPEMSAPDTDNAAFDNDSADDGNISDDELTAAAMPDLAGKAQAVWGFTAGILAVPCMLLGKFAFASIILAIAGIYLTISSKKAGFVSIYRTMGFVCSILALIGGIIITVAYFLFVAPHA